MLSRLFIVASVWLLRFAAAEAGDSRSMGCGPRALSLAASLLGQDISRQALRGAFRRLDGTHSLREISDAVAVLGFASRAVRHDRLRPPNPGVPAIVPVRGTPSSSRPDHFVVVLGTTRGVHVFDGHRAPVFENFDVFAQRWEGTAVYIATDEADLPSTKGPGLGLISLAALVAGTGVYGFIASMRRGAA